MSPFRPDIVDIWIFRVKERQQMGFRSEPAPADPASGSARTGDAGATAPGNAGPSTDRVEILLMRRAPGRILPGLWQCVSGSLEPGESVPAGALRELFEETGLGPDSIEAFFDVDLMTLRTSCGNACRSSRSAWNTTALFGRSLFNSICRASAS